MSEGTPRRYGKWAGNSIGVPEDPKRCIHTIFDRYGSPGGHQCAKPRGHGPDGQYCKVHNPEAVKARQDKSMQAYREKMEAEMRPYRRAAAMREALQAIADGHNNPRELADETLKEWFKT